MLSQIQRVSQGVINNVHDTVIGGTASLNLDGSSKVAGQLGQVVQLDTNMLIVDLTKGTVHPGDFQYVQFDPAGLSSPAVGDTAYWKAGTTPEEFIVAATGSDAAGFFVTPDQLAAEYTFIQTTGFPPEPVV